MTRNLSKGFFHHPICTCVAVMKRVAQHLPLTIQQHEIHSPSVCTNGHHLLTVPSARYSETVLDLLPEPEHVPAQRIRDGHWPIGEPMNFFQSNVLPIP